MSFVIKLDNGYVRWSHIGGYTVVINPELATVYDSKSSAMAGRPWFGDSQRGEVVSGTSTGDIKNVGANNSNLPTTGGLKSVFA